MVAIALSLAIYSLYSLYRLYSHHDDVAKLDMSCTRCYCRSKAWWTGQQGGAPDCSMTARLRHRTARSMPHDLHSQQICTVQIRGSTCYLQYLESFCVSSLQLPVMPCCALDLTHQQATVDLSWHQSSFSMAVSMYSSVSESLSSPAACRTISCLHSELSICLYASQLPSYQNQLVVPVVLVTSGIARTCGKIV